ncbi:Imm1 family immunity protein [Streptomyces virginiae]|uniref:Imm1 family immunity protein n=2 Tax=Streptomyces virginiae TaxID=1961 RepID=UPI00131C9B12|nr:Imm1 family immunity protein [Streptomyces virginiae]
MKAKAMILSLFFKGEWHYSEGPDQTSRLVAEVVESLRGEETGEPYFPGEDAWFCLSGRRYSDAEPVPGCNLRVAINPRHGYGALVWFADDQFHRSGGVYDSVWVSNNPEPIDFNPNVVSDPGYPLFHDQASTLPTSRIREAVEEFCRKGSGDRPECIDWVKGHVNGQRLDRPSIVEVVEEPDIDWDLLR